MDGLYPGEVVLEERGQGGGKHGDPVFVTFAGVDDDLMAFKVEVLDPECEAFCNS